MINTFVGNLGHFLVILSFITSLLAAFAYYRSSRQDSLAEQQRWKRFARFSFGIHSAAVLGVVFALFYIIYNHLYEYFYAYEHSSNNLPVHYMISCYWEGQEGSFLLWIFWNVLLGLILMRSTKDWEAPVMMIFAAVQAFLTSMILGVVFFESFKIGSSPFILTRDVLQIPKYNPQLIDIYDPNYVPPDGTGLNPLLQNYWMVIHPPTLFLGFALTLVPFAFVIGGLWQKRFKDWIKPSTPWALAAAGILGLGILMGAYWAYETLNFGGYWNWDPVENAVYVPWLILVAAIHTTMGAGRSTLMLKVGIILHITTFILILYSTFLTRSGVLGDASVHSFTDLGLSGQLLLYLLFFTASAIVLAAVRWRLLPTSAKELQVYSSEFWLLIGASVLGLAAFQVINTTSIPVYRAVAEAFGLVANFAPPNDAIAHYTNIQALFTILIVIFSSIGQYMWWKRANSGQALWKHIAPSLSIALIISAFVILFSKEDNFFYMAILTAGIFALVANMQIAVGLLRKNPRLSGGSMAHIGVALMLIGVLYSAGYSKVISLNESGLLITTSDKAPEDFNETNVLLWLEEPAQMGKYQITYKGNYIEADGISPYIRQRDVFYTDNPYRIVSLKDIYHEGAKIISRGDTLRTQPENVYYRVEYRTPEGRLFNLYPRVQFSSAMGQPPASPSIRKEWHRDVYTHVTMIYPDPEEGREWKEMEEFTVALKDTFFVNDYIAIFEGIESIPSDPLVTLEADEAAVKANIRILDKNGEHLVQPSLLVSPRRGILSSKEEVPELGLRFTFQNIDEQSGKFTFGVNRGQKDYIVMKAMEKPMINILWIGSVIMLMGFGIAVWKHLGNKLKTKKQVENPESELEAIS